ncbi:peptide-methionine (S)-S-oxide reductase MsrA [Gangjinia marincola]|uniref:Peptide methionine sulfoxide reductase MsrA n=1 Tax=Gangjinia marincola TaxID=578463 RepID=A0ABN1MD18_9FLAO
MSSTKETAVFAAGCFWCTEAVFERVEGVYNVLSGYTGGQIKNPAYREICTGRTGHAEGIQFAFDPQVISYNTLLDIFFTTHDPTTLNQQGHDRGTQYRSAIFYTSEEQKQLAEAKIEELNDRGIFDDPIVTEVTPLDVFYVAEEDHQDFYTSNPNQPYCRVVINPKLEKLRNSFSDKLKSNRIAG